MGRVVVIGGGIAGVSVAAELSRRGREVLVVERETQLGTQSTGRSAAIFRLAVAEPVNVRLARRSRDIGRRVVADGTVTSLGGLYPCDDDDERRRLLDAAGFAGVRASTREDVPDLLLHRDRPGVFSPEDGVIDTHALLHGLASEARRSGAVFALGRGVDELVLEAGRVVGVRLGSEELQAQEVVDATGAWSPSIAPSSETGVRPHRRHLFILDTPLASALRTVVWDLTEGIYLRPESGGLLVSPCDEQAMAGTDHVPTSPDAGTLLFEKLSRWAPALAGAAVRRVWAGLRPLTTDHRFVVGPDPRVPGLFRLGGFGGHGMTAGAAAGELAAAMLCGEWPADAGELAPGRFQSA